MLTVRSNTSRGNRSLRQKAQGNHNLEQQFRALYSQFFISSSQKSNEVELSRIISFQEGPGIRNWQYVEEDGIKFINIRCIIDGDIDTSSANMISKEEAYNKYRHFLLDENDIVMSCSGTLGRYAIVRKEHLPLCLNTSVIRFKPKEQLEDFAFIYGYLTSNEFLNRQQELACGSVQANFGPTHLKAMAIQEFPSEYRRIFSHQAQPLLDDYLNNLKENAKLQQLRDYLLPRLMSGELKINDLTC